MEIKKIYNVDISVNYLTYFINNSNNIDDDTINDLYKKQLNDVLMNNINEYFDDNCIDCSIKKIDALYKYLRLYHNEFLKYVLHKILIINDNHYKLSNNLYFYLCLCNFTNLSADMNKNFDIMEHFNNPRVEEFILNFLFGFYCFEYIHSILTKYFEGDNFKLSKDELEHLFTNDMYLASLITRLSDNFTKTFDNK